MKRYEDRWSARLAGAAHLKSVRSEAGFCVLTDVYMTDKGPAPLTGSPSFTPEYCSQNDGSR